MKLKWASRAGVRIAYTVEGSSSSPALIFCNSLGTDMSMWEPQVQSLSSDFYVVRHDSRGQGASGSPEGPYSLDMMAADVVAVLDDAGIDMADVCGLSLGGLVAQVVAARWPRRIRRAVFANTASRIGTRESWEARIRAVEEGGMAGVRSLVIARFLSERVRETRPDIVRTLLRMIENSNPRGYTGCCEALRDGDTGPLLSSLTAQSLVIAGELDQSTPPAQGEALARALPDSALQTLAGAAHLSNIEKPAEFTDAVRSFLQPD